MGLRGNRTESTRRNRWAGLLVSLSLIAAACGTNSGGQASPGAEETGTGGTSPGAASPDAASPGGGGASGEITAWAMGNEGVLLGDFVDRYAEENPDAQVDITPVDWGIARDRLLTAIGGNQTPDVSQMGTDMMGEFIETGALAPLAADI
ncbi:MAG: extracellular solute-binding protein, partial [Candidatus Limnocylindrales bacterium]